MESPDDFSFQIRQEFLDSYHRNVEGQTRTMHLMEAEEYRQQLPNFDAEFAARYEQQTLEERLADVPALATAASVTDAILFALARHAHPS